MCAIVGFISKNPSSEAILTLKRLFIESKIRGMHAYGYASIEGKPQLQKSNQLKPLLESIKKPTALIGHCRYSTSGDYLDMNNNQPLQHGSEYLAFNGVIDMRTKPEMEKAYNITMSCDNDGEIMLQDHERLAMLDKNISFAGLFLDDKQLTFMRNLNRPAYIAHKHDSVYIGSTADIMKRAMLNPEPLEPFKEYIWAV